MVRYTLWCLLCFLITLAIFILLHKKHDMLLIVLAGEKRDGYQLTIDSISAASGFASVFSLLLAIVFTLVTIKEAKDKNPGKELSYIANKFLGEVREINRETRSAIAGVTSAFLIKSGVHVASMDELIPAGAVTALKKKTILKPIQLQRNIIKFSIAKVADGIYIFSACIFFIISVFYALQYINEYAHYNTIKLDYTIKFIISMFFLIGSMFELLIILEVLRDRHDTAVFSKNVIFQLADKSLLFRNSFISKMVYRRCSIIKNNHSDLPSLHDLLPAASTLDADIVSNRYLSLSVFIWALPVIGFIGTAFGMQSSISGFKMGLTDIANIKDQLGPTLDGLSGAFDSTIAALGATLILHFCANAIKRIDISNLEKLDGSCLEILSVIPSPNDTNYSDSNAILSQLEVIADRMHKLLDVPSALEKIIDTSQSVCEQSANNYQLLLKLSDSVLDKIDRVTQGLNRLAGSMNGLSEISENLEKGVDAAKNTSEGLTRDAELIASSAEKIENSSQVLYDRLKAAANLGISMSFSQQDGGRMIYRVPANTAPIVTEPLDPDLSVKGPG